MIWIKCPSCGYGYQVTRQHGESLGQCTVCGSRMVRVPSGLAVRRLPEGRCYRELCHAELLADGRTCQDGHEQPPY